MNNKQNKTGSRSRDKRIRIIAQTVSFWLMEEGHIKRRLFTTKGFQKGVVR